MGFGPLRGPHQARLLAIPAGIHQRASWSPTGLEQGADGARLGELGDHACQRIPRAFDPGVVMVAADDPLIGEVDTFESGNHVVDGLQAPLGLDQQVDFCRPRSEVIGER